jgi:hypothetical protein
MLFSDSDDDQNVVSDSHEERPPRRFLSLFLRKDKNIERILNFSVKDISHDDFLDMD